MEGEGKVQVELVTRYGGDGEAGFGDILQVRAHVGEVLYGRHAGRSNAPVRAGQLIIVRFAGRYLSNYAMRNAMRLVI